MEELLRRTPLYARHREAGAQIAPFAGFEMPVRYGSILEEHRAVRSSAGLFDVSHMGEIRLRGPGASKLAQRVFTNDVCRMTVGRVRYGLLCAEDGGVVDDATLYRVAEDELLFCVNAATTQADLEWILEARRRSGLACEVIDESPATALLAVQGPRAVDIVGRLLDDREPTPRRWRFRAVSIAGVPAQLSRTGYTGEDGYEIYLPNERAVELWDALLRAGGPALRPIGLGARDTLRTEQAYPLYGHELDRSRNPLEAGLERFVAFGKGFIGEAALERARRDGPAQRLVGLLLDSRRVARPGCPIVGDEAVGTITSGTFAPSIERSIAIGYVPARCAIPGVQLQIEIRGQLVPCEVTETPFYVRKS